VSDRVSIKASGLLLITTAFLFVMVFSFLAIRFGYPDVLERPASEVLPQLLDGGFQLQAVWWVYALLPLLIIPAAVGAQSSLRWGSAAAAQNGTYCAVLAALTLTLGLIRWPSLNHMLATLYATASPADRSSIEILFYGFNQYLGVYVGEQLGEIFLNGWFLFAGWAMLRHAAYPRWLGMIGMATGILGLVGMFRFATGAVDIVSEVNNLLLPLWLIVFGAALLRYGTRESGTSAHARLDERPAVPV
jgi:hypothetical protein